jgi:hypothetical protein
VVALGKTAITSPSASAHVAHDSVRWMLPETLRLCAAQIGPLLICGAFGFVGAAMLASAVFTGLTLDAYLRSEGFFSAFQRNTVWLYGTRAIFGALLLTLSRGAIAWIALNADKVPLNAREALKHAARRWPALLTSALIYGLLITLATLGLSIVLRELRLDLSNFRWLRSNDGDSLTRALVVNALSLLPPDPGAPFTEFLAAVRFSLGRDSGVISSGWRTPRIPDALSAPMLGLAIVSCAAIIVIDALFALRTAAAIRVERRNPLAWLPLALHMSAHNLGWVVTHRWLFRLLIVILLIVGATLPTLLQQGLLLPAIARETRSYWPYAIGVILQGIAAALIGMLLGIVQTVYEARMFARLTGK